MVHMIPLLALQRQWQTLCCTDTNKNSKGYKDNSGHWHDAEVKVHGDKLVITYEDEDA